MYIIILRSVLLLFTYLFAFVCLFVFSSRVTILRDKDTRESKGVAFVLFLDRQMAHKAVTAINRKQVLLVSWLTVATKISLLATIYNSVYLPRIVTPSSSQNTSLSIIDTLRRTSHVYFIFCEELRLISISQVVRFV